MLRFLKEFRDHGLAVLLALAVTLGGFAADAAAAGKANVDGKGVGLHGFDPVAYYFDGTEMRGTPKYQAEHKGVTYYFASEFNMAAFEGAPEFFAPSYGGYCAFGMAMGRQLDVDPASWSIVDGKLYLANNRKVLQRWRAEAGRNIAMADQNWAKLN